MTRPVVASGGTIGERARVAIVEASAEKSERKQLYNSAVMAINWMLPVADIARIIVHLRKLDK